MEPKGLFPKYVVTKADGTPVDNAFILRPDRDQHARKALLAYAESVRESNPELCGDLVSWVNELEDLRRRYLDEERR